MAKHPTAKVTLAEYETLAEFRYSLRKFLHFSEEAAAAAGLTPQSHQALLAIKGFPSGLRMTIGDLAERLQIRHNSAVGLVDRLVQKRLVKRMQDKADRRQAWLALTKQGEAVLETLSAAHKEQLQQSGPQIETLLKRLRSGSA